MIEAIRKKNYWYQAILATLPLFSIATFFGVWIAIWYYTNGRIPNPLQVIERFIVLLQQPIGKVPFYVHILISLRRVVIGLCSAIGIGIPFGLMLGYNKSFRAMFKPLFYMLRPIPPIAWMPLITMWFGVGEISKVIIIFIGCLSPIIMNTFTGVAMVPPLNIQVGKMFGANGKKMLSDIMLPSAFPAIFAGIRTALGTGWVVMLAAEMISSKQGLGFLIIRGSDSGDLSLVMVGMVFIGGIGALLTFIATRIERWLCPWVQNIN